ncbi:MAG: hypothetical protein OXI41_12460 [Chloroflexota bacterium]|nr:hypothetical protein [Chloroflexota bacterium]MDE2895107.1 hypothetical protein [Chloroflexota bacterium]
MPDDFNLPQMFREHEDATYTAQQLAPTLRRLRAAVDDISELPVTPEALAAAWTRIAELRLPRKAVPGPVLHEIEELIVDWGSHGIGGIAARAYSLGESQRETEALRIRRMLEITESAAANAPLAPLYESE